MAITRYFYVESLEYRSRIRPAISRMGGKLLYPDSSDGRNIEIFSMEEWKTVLIYDGDKGIIFWGVTNVPIKQTLSRLEQLSGFGLLTEKLLKKQQNG